MNRTWWKFGIALPWLGLALIALRYSMVWDRLPVRLATHFNAANQPNGWMSREGSLYFILGLYFFLVTLFSVVLVAIQWARKLEPAAWAILGLFYVILGVVFYSNEAVLAYNLTGAPIQLLPMIIPVLVAIVVVSIIAFSSRRGKSLPSGSVLAEEVHAGRFFALVFFIPAIFELAAIYALPNTVARLAFGIGALISLMVGAIAWSGFTYLFTTTGVEIRTLGFRLRSIPTEQIREYAADRWSMIGGYGIRGLGARRAYIWGNRGVRIKTSDGEVFLGHSNPDKIVRDLDAIKH